MDDATLATWIDALLPGQKLCGELPLRNQVTRCVTVLGVNMVNKASDPQILMAWCDRVPDYSRDFCRAGQPDAPLDAQGRPVRQEPGGSPGG